MVTFLSFIVWIAIGIVIAKILGVFTDSAVNRYGGSFLATVVLFGFAAGTHSYYTNYNKRQEAFLAGFSNLEEYEVAKSKGFETKSAFDVYMTEEKQAARDNAKPQVVVKKPEETPPTTETKIVCDKFELVAKVTGYTLDLSIDTDLPDNVIVMVNVSRYYFKKDDTDVYSVDYFSEKSAIGKWKSKQSISIASEKWKKALRAKQEEMSRLGLDFDVASISNKIAVSMVVPVNQPDPKFGDRNQNLIGKVVSTKGIRVVKDEIEIDYPLNAPPVGKSPFPSLNPLELEIGQAYVVSKQAPLMPSHSPADPIVAIQKMKQIPQGGGFKVLEVYKEKTNPWYRVIAFDQRTEKIGTGWINSAALLGQQLKAHK